MSEVIKETREIKSTTSMVEKGRWPPILRYPFAGYEIPTMVGRHSRNCVHLGKEHRLAGSGHFMSAWSWGCYRPKMDMLIRPQQLVRL